MTTTDTELLVTRQGVRLHVRPACDADEPALAAFFARVSPEDLRFRFLTGVREVSHARLSSMIHANDEANESLVAFADDGSIVAAAMLAGDDRATTAEAAIAIQRDRKQQGIGDLARSSCRACPAQGIPGDRGDRGPRQPVRYPGRNRHGVRAASRGG